MTIKLGAKLPKDDDRNGLHEIYREAIRDPRKAHVLIVVVDTAKVINDVENYDTVPQLRILAVEPIGGDDAGRLRAILQRHHEERTGNLELPAEWESVLAGMASPTLPGTETGR